MLSLLVACKHSRVIRPVLTQDHLPRNSFSFTSGEDSVNCLGNLSVAQISELGSNDGLTRIESAADVNR